jgi:hypothetical protein
MKALTILQPYAHLIVTPPHVKRVENRTWATPYRGPLAIHAGKSRQFLDPGDPIDQMAFGAIVGICNLVDIVHFEGIDSPKNKAKYPWLHDHDHAFGPYIWILEVIRTLEKPIPYLGKQGLFNVPDDLLEIQS